MKPTKQLSFDLAKTDLNKTGFWWCLCCSKVTELRDQGEYNQRCLHCGSLRVKWCPPNEATPQREIKKQKALPLLKPKPVAVKAGSVVDFSAEGLAKKKRLPMDKRDLRKLYQTGYYFCFGCLEVTELTDGDKCCLCDNKDVRWQDGVESNNPKEPHVTSTVPDAALGAAVNNPLHTLLLSGSGVGVCGGDHSRSCRMVEE